MLTLPEKNFRLIRPRFWRATNNALLLFTRISHQADGPRCIFIPDPYSFVSEASSVIPAGITRATPHSEKKTCGQFPLFWGCNLHKKSPSFLFRKSPIHPPPDEKWPQSGRCLLVEQPMQAAGVFLPFLFLFFGDGERKGASAAFRR